MPHNCATRAFSIAVLAGLLAATTSLATAGPAEICRTKQITAIGKACSTLLKKCYGGPAKAGLIVDRICLGDAQVKFGSDVDSAEAAGSCDQSGIDMVAWPQLLAFAESVATTQLAYRTDGDCAAKKLKAAAKKCSSYAKCYASAAKESTPFTPASGCLATASGKFTQFFSKIDSAGICATTGNGDAVETLVDDVIADLSVLYTTGTTTTTLPN